MNLMQYSPKQLISTKGGQWAGRHEAQHKHCMRSYSTARHEHVARHDTYVGWAGLRILDTWALKVQYD